jgi:hypothetical protein
MLTALLLAAALFAATISATLAATVTQPLGSAFGGLASCAFSYDDTTRVIQQFTLDNQDTITHTIAGSLIDPITLNTIATHAYVEGPHTTQILTVTALGIQMVDKVAKDGTTHYLGLPVIIGCAIS